MAPGGRPAAALDGRKPETDLARRPRKNRPSEAFTSGGSTVMFIRWQSSRCSTSESFFLKFRPRMSLDSSAAMNSTGQWAFK